MIISPNKERGLDFPVSLQEKIVAERTQATNNIVHEDATEENKLLAIEQIKEVVKDSDSKFYIFSKPAKELADRIHFDFDKFQASFLSFIPNGKKVTFLLGDTFYRWVKLQNKILVFAYYEFPIISKLIESTKLGNGKVLNNYDINYAFFSIHLKENQYSFPNEIYPFTENTWIEIIRMIIFTELQELETVTLNPNQSVGTRKQGKFKNESKSRVVIVDSLWNKTLVRENGFLVSGHARLQGFGVGMQQRKLIWIDTFEKHGYVRQAKKTTV